MPRKPVGAGAANSSRGTIPSRSHCRGGGRPPSPGTPEAVARNASCSSSNSWRRMRRSPPRQGSGPRRAGWARTGRRRAGGPHPVCDSRSRAAPEARPRTESGGPAPSAAPIGVSPDHARPCMRSSGDTLARCRRLARWSRRDRSRAARARVRGPGAASARRDDARRPRRRGPARRPPRHAAGRSTGCRRPGRRSAVLDLAAPEGVAAALDLAAAADVLVEGFRPGVMERLGLGPTSAWRATRGSSTDA